MTPNPTGRRGFLSLLAGAALCPICASILVPGARAEETMTDAHAGGSHAKWDYEGEDGPQRWGDIDPDFKICKLGRAQTPINLAGAARADLGGLEIGFAAEAPFNVINNGHTIQANFGPGSRTVIEGVAYDLLQFHFHHPSEHLLEGRGFDLECHFVHRAATGALAVLGSFIRPGAENAALRPVWNAMPMQHGREVAGTGTVPLAGLLPRDRDYFRYAGSLTTPPCSEGVTWTVFKDPVEASPEQIRRFAKLFPNNSRPIQETNRRALLRSF
jgi:carbonic anhydrase